MITRHFHKTRSIIHLNIANFAAAIECVLDSRLRGWPVIVAPGNAQRVAVYDMNQEAFAAGIRKGMPLFRALRLCKAARLVTPRPDRYQQAMNSLFRKTLFYSPLVESGETDGHLFLDVTGTARLFAPPEDLARRLQQEIKKDLGLEPIWSLASNKLVAKVASRLVKPNGEYIVTAGEEEAFLAPLPLALIPGIEREDLRRLNEFNLTRAGELTALGPDILEAPLGSRARLLYRLARGIDPSPVLPAGEKPPAVFAEHEFGTDTNDAAVPENTLFGLVEKAGCELRQRGRATRRIAIILNYTDGICCARQTMVCPASADDLILFTAARRALKTAWARRIRIRRIRLVCDRLVFPPAQLELFTSERKKKEKRDSLVSTVDGIRRRFGNDAIQVARMLAA